MFEQVVDRLAARLASEINSLLVVGGNIATQQSNKRTEEFLFGDEGAYFKFLERYNFVESVIEIISTSIEEVIAKSKFEVVISKDQTLEKSINDYFKEINLRKFIVDNLPKFIYYGSYFGLIDKETDETNTKFKIFKVEEPQLVKFVEKYGRFNGYIINSDRYHKADKGIGYWYKKDEPINLKVQEMTRFKGSDKFKISKSLPKDVIVFSYFSGKGIFNTQLTKIFQLYVKEFILEFLSLKDSIKPDIISVLINAPAKRSHENINVTNAIETMLNSMNNVIGQINPQNFLHEVLFQLFNSTKVVPGVENYSSISPLDLPNLTEKRERLQTEVKEAKTSILNNIGIPEELFSGTGNRWEIISRSDRYVTLISAHINALISMVKRSVIIRAKFEHKKDLVEDDIKFTLDGMSFLINNSSKNKINALSEKFADISRVIATTKELMASEILDKNKVIDYTKKQLTMVDEEAAELFMEKVKKSTEPQKPTTGQIRSVLRGSDGI